MSFILTSLRFKPSSLFPSLVSVCSSAYSRLCRLFLSWFLLCSFFALLFVFPRLSASAYVLRSELLRSMEKYQDVLQNYMFTE